MSTPLTEVGRLDHLNTGGDVYVPYLTVGQHRRDDPAASPIVDRVLAVYDATALVQIRTGGLLIVAIDRLSHDRRCTYCAATWTRFDAHLDRRPAGSNVGDAQVEITTPDGRPAILVVDACLDDERDWEMERQYDYSEWPDEEEEDLEAAIFDLEAPPLTLMMAADAPPHLRAAAALIEPFAPSGLAIEGQIAHFNGLPAEVAAELLRVVADEHLQFRQGGVAPTARAMLEQCAAHPSRTCQGYITLPPRDDQRLAVDGLTCPDLGWDARETDALYAKLAPLEPPDDAAYYTQLNAWHLWWD